MPIACAAHQGQEPSALPYWLLPVTAQQEAELHAPPLRWTLEAGAISTAMLAPASHSSAKG